MPACVAADQTGLAIKLIGLSRLGHAAVVIVLATRFVNTWLVLGILPLNVLSAYQALLDCRTHSSEPHGPSRRARSGPFCLLLQTRLSASAVSAWHDLSKVVSPP